ncbi:hypothetical protein PR048_002335 [Dryococelus australis]|uniref:Uncharacterized protein n=1 Tax=Dryococelus australis TaxID=614101 RepID=A0ABQ9IJX3_9NEOP|nr:hypothetical protein PR048_002335 [Dryococelus australis]
MNTAVWRCLLSGPCTTAHASHSDSTAPLDCATNVILHVDQSHTASPTALSTLMVLDCYFRPYKQTDVGVFPSRWAVFNSWRGRSRIFARGNRAGRCRWSAGFLGDISFPRPCIPVPLHTPFSSPTSALKTPMLRAALKSLHSTCARNTILPIVSRLLPRRRSFSPSFPPHLASPSVLRSDQQRFGPFLVWGIRPSIDSPMLCLLQPSQLPLNAREDVFPYDYVNTWGISDEQQLPLQKTFQDHLMDYSKLLWPVLVFSRENKRVTELRNTATSHLPYRGHCFYFFLWGRGGLVVRLLASHLDEIGSIPGGVAPGCSHAGIVPGDAADWQVFPGISRFLRSCIPALLLTHLTSASSLRVAQISPLSTSFTEAEYHLEATTPNSRFCSCDGGKVEGMYRLFTGLYEMDDDPAGPASGEGEARDATPSPPPRVRRLHYAIATHYAAASKPPALIRKVTLPFAPFLPPFLDSTSPCAPAPTPLSFVRPLAHLD